MAKKSSNNTATDIAATTSVAANVSDADKTKKENVKKTTTPRRNVKIDDGEEVEVISLIPNVSYLDSKTGDTYEWEEAGHIEYITFETLKDMWRNSKGYFRNLWLKPLDERVLVKFGLVKNYENYEFIMDESNYNAKNKDKLVELIKSAKNELRFSICNKIKSLIVDGKLSDVRIIKALEETLDADFISLI